MDGSNSVSKDGSVESEAGWVSESMVGATDVLMDGWMDKSNGGSKSGSMESMYMVARWLNCWLDRRLR